MNSHAKILSDSWKGARRAKLVNSIRAIKPFNHLSADDIDAMVQSAQFKAFDLGDTICKQVQQPHSPLPVDVSRNMHLINMQ